MRLNKIILTLMLFTFFSYAEAVDDNFTVGSGEILSANVLENDTGDYKSVTQYTLPSCGEITSFYTNGNFTYDSKDCSGIVTFTYTMQYYSGWWWSYSDTATVFINIESSQNNGETEYLSGFQPFELINPKYSRNVRGNMAIAGNTVLCLTEKYSGYGGTCQDNSSYLTLTSNLRVSKYLDIDNNSSTWDSTSSNIELPDSYEQDNGKGIIWAALFWQGRFSIDKDYKLHFGKRENNGYSFVETGYGSSYNNLDIENTEANLINLKIDNNPYKEIVAKKVIQYTSSNGTTYAAYADVTKILQDANLTKGKHTFTVANLFTEEGREATPGIFGGWSLLIIYKDNLEKGIVKNFSVYYGFQTAYDDTPIEIKGFRLPRYGDVNSIATLFSGEGEFRYGRNSIYPRDYDWIKISNKKNSNYQYMPDANGNDLPNNDEYGNRDNIFDAKLTGILRDHIAGKYNDLYYNNDGVDVDVFNTSKIMKSYRDDNKDIDTVYLKTNSNDDYVTPSMLAFATDLYTPEVCYDYDIKLGDYYDVPVDENRSFTIDNYDNLPLQVKILIRSKEADFDLIHSKIYVKFTPDDTFSFDHALYSLPNTYEYVDAVVIDQEKGVVATGEDPDETGGTIKPNETMYTKFYFNFKKEHFKGKFDVYLDTNITFDGENQINYLLTTNASSDSKMYIPRCPTNPVYDPIHGMFNVENANATFDQDEATRSSLKTQVVGVPYDITIASYKKDTNGEYTKPKKRKTYLELELINAGTFENNSSAGYDSTCENPDYHPGAFVYFDNEDRIKVEIPKVFIDYNSSNYNKDISLRNAAFRLWVLTKKDENGNTIMVNNRCRNRKDANCYRELYNENYNQENDKYCHDTCNNGEDDECYQCLRIHHSVPICSRDNFAIRPYTYNINIIDNNETKSSTEIIIGDNNIPRINHISAGYAYKIDANASGYGDITRARGYYFTDANASDLKSSSANYLNSGTNCADTSNKYVNIVIIDGKTTKEVFENNETNSSDNALFIDNVGKYNFYISDKEWTLVDQQGYPYKPYPNIADCEKNSTAILADSKDAENRGCDIRSNASPKYDLTILSHPYRFDINNTTVFPTKEYVYMNDLNSSINSIKTGSEMALSVSSTIRAIAKNGKVLTNYTDGCMAQDLNITLRYQTTPSTIKTSKGNNIYVQSTYYSGTIDNNITISDNNFSDTNITYTINKEFFSNVFPLGTTNITNYININRAFNDPINPFRLKVIDLNISDKNETMNVDLNNTHYPSGYKDINTTKTFYYARAKASQDFYDDITEFNITTPIQIILYCDDTLENCKNFGIDTNKTVNDEYAWFLSIDHNASNGDGQVILTSDKPNDVNITPQTVVDFKDGVDINVTVSSTNVAIRPFTAKIEPTDDMKNNYPWLLYNKNGNVLPSYIYKVRFVPPFAKWSGEGSAGYSIDVNNSMRKTNRIDW